VSRLARALLPLLVAAAAPAARAQTMLDQQHRLIDVHDLLLDLPPVAAPASLRPWQAAVGVEGITVPSIDGQTGNRRQITASDHTPLFPRPRVALGLPMPEGLRAFVGVSYIPPVTLLDVSTHFGAAEAGVAWAPGSLAVGVRGHVVQAFSKTPVTDPSTKDTLESTLYGGDVSAGWTLDLPWGSATPYAIAGVTHAHGRFRVTTDGVVLTHDDTAPLVGGGIRALFGRRWEAVAELDAYPGRLVHPNFRLGWLFDVR
jgi:hypothetical protein